MVTAREVPGSFTVRWAAGTPQSSFAPSPARARGAEPDSPGSDAPRRRYRSSCDNCRKSRVKCSGGTPCRRCTGLSGFSSCTYGVSQRRGKRKAAERESTPGTSQSTPSHESPQVDVPWAGLNLADGLLDAGDLLQFSAQPQIGDAAFSLQATPLDANLSVPMPGLTDDMDDSFLWNDFTTTGLTPSGAPWSGVTAKLVSNSEHEVCDCYATNQRFLKRIDSTTQAPEKSSLDQVLHVIQEAAAHAATYLACTHCNGGCPRLISLAILHQRLVGLACTVTKNPEKFLRGPGNDGVRFTLGTYCFPEEDDLEFKRLAVLSATRRISSVVTVFANAIRRRQGEDSLYLSDAGKLNLSWLHDVETNLTSRLKTIASILEKPDWTSFAT